MRRLALLLAGGALWLVFAAAPAFADGGPHQLALNNGTSGLSGDCAACHRAHTAPAADLLKTDQSTLCLSCHNGTGATTDVVDGYQFVPNGSGNPTTAVLGALRGGGFNYTLIGDPARLSYWSRGGITVTFSAAPSGSVDLVWPTFTGFAGGTLTISTPLSASAIQTSADALFGTSTAYTSSTASSSMTGTHINNMYVTVSGNVVTFAPQNAFRLVATLPVPTTANNTTGTTVTVANGLLIGAASHVGVLTSGIATTSTHLGAGTVWGNGAQGIGTAGATGVTLECTNCHNPHGNGQYRILQTLPGTDWSGGGWTAPSNAVMVADVGSTASTKNYTVLPGIQASSVIGTATQGDYWRSKYDPTGAANYTNFYLKGDPMNSGWDPSTTSYAALTNATGAITAWCIQCHTRYNGYNVGGSPSSLALQTPSDATFMYKHGTTHYGCEQCHVSHGTSALMTAQFSSTYKFPDGSSEDSALLKVSNRGTCNLCHDPTATLTGGTTVGPVPTAITPGP